MEDKPMQVIPLWCRETDGGGLSLTLTPRAGDVLLTLDSFEEHSDRLRDRGRPELLVFDMPSEAIAASAAIRVARHGSTSERRGGEAHEVGVTASGYGVMMRHTDDEPIEDTEFTVHDLRTPTGYLADLYGSWEFKGPVARALVEAVPAERVDLASLVVENIAALKNPALTRAIQAGLEALPGAIVGMPALSVEDLAADLTIGDDVTADSIQSVLIGFARRIDAGDIADRLACAVRDAFGQQVRPAGYSDGMEL